MTTAFKKLVDNNIDAYNSYSEAQRARMFDKISKDITDVQKEITKTFRDAETIKYPLRMSTLQEKQIAGESKRMTSIQFANSLAPNVRAGIYSSEQLMLAEIKKASNIDDRDTATALIEAVEMLLPESYKPGAKTTKFYQDFAELKKSYFEKIGVSDISETIKDLEARKAELEFILYCIEKKDEFILLPRQFQEMFGGVDLGKDAKAREASIRLVDYTNRAMQFLSLKQVKLKN